MIVYIYIYICVYIYIYLRVCVYIYIYIYMNMEGGAGCASFCLAHPVGTGQTSTWPNRYQAFLLQAVVDRV